MVHTTTCTYSGRQILPGYGKRFAKNDKSLHVFLNAKCALQFHHKWNARKVSWTLIARRNNGKEQVIASKHKESKKAVVTSRGYGNVSAEKLEELRKKFMSGKKWFKPSIR